MELFGILFSIPAAFVASIVYCAFLAYVVRRHDRVRLLLYAGSLILLGSFCVKLVLLERLGAVGSRALVGPGFYVAHTVFFIFGTRALANVLVLPRRGPLLGPWWFSAIICTAFALFLVVLQYVVSEALYGIDGTNGPFS